MKLLRSLATICMVMLLNLSLARATPADICRAAAAQVARETDVPYAVLLAITLTETGRTIDGVSQPWAWAVNNSGDGHWFATRSEAERYARAALTRGEQSFDTGCFQINYRWHHQHFASLEEMFDPVQNGRYAARFLRQLYAETGDWSRAAGTYHSRTAVHATRYRAIFDRFYAMEVRDTATTQPRPAGLRTNTFSLLQSGSNARASGSLVPLGDG